MSDHITDLPQPNITVKVLSPGQLSKTQRLWLERGLKEPGGKLPLFDQHGQRVSERTVRSCVEKGWAEPWFENPIKPDWIVCRLTDRGRQILEVK